MRKAKIWSCVLAGVLALTGVARAAEEGNPEYKMWSKYKPGTMVKTKSVTSGGAETQIETTTTLKEVTAEKLVLTSQTSMSVMGQKFEQPASDRDVPAKTPTTPTPETPEGVRAGDVKSETGEETIEVAGKQVKAKWTQTTTKQGDTTTTAKVWQSDEIPGGLAKMESRMEGGDTPTTVTLTVTEFVVK